ncbi:MAG TPA: glycosyltransferase family 4 protein [Nakamurella sp.]
MVAVVPAGLDDPTRPSGGNTYDRRVLDALADRGWRVSRRPAPGSWPRPTQDEVDAFGRLLRHLPDDAVVLVDGLIASAAAGALVPESARLRLVALVHMPLDTDDERDVLRRSRCVIVTSRWTGDRLVRRNGLDPARVAVAEPGTDPAAPAAGSPDGTRLLSVGVIAPHKGQDLLVDALTRLSDLDWSCTAVGALDVEPDFADRVRDGAAAVGDRVRFPGPLVGDDLAAAYAAADLLVLPSRAETFGLVVGEALARGIPVVAGEVGGVPQALGRDRSGQRPGLLVDPGDARALAAALRAWLIDPRLRDRLRRAALGRRETLTGWPVTADRVSRALLEVAR